MYRVIICDDNPKILDMVERIVNDVSNTLSEKIRIHTYTDPRQISQQVLSSCDMALLDIDFNSIEMNGMEFAKTLRQFRTDAIIIFITNFIEYAPEGYEVQAFRYVLKRKLKKNLPVYLNEAFSQLKIAKESLKIQINGEIIDILLENIMYMEVDKHYVTIHCKNSASSTAVKNYVVHTSLSDFEQQLNSRGFLRIHKSFLVNMKHLTSFHCREAVLSDGTVLRVSEKNYATQKQKYLLWKGWH